jgi:hypothetical protein
MAKHFKLRGIRIHQSYEVGEVAEIVGASEQTVRRWITNGLPVLNSMRPALILGFELKSYLEGLQSKPMSEAALGAIMCMSCRKRQMPLGLMADYILTSTTNGRLVALCGKCEGVCVRFTSKASLPALSKVLEITQMPCDEPNGTKQSPAKT